LEKAEFQLSPEEFSIDFRNTLIPREVEIPYSSKKCKGCHRPRKPGKIREIEIDYGKPRKVRKM